MKDGLYLGQFCVHGAHCYGVVNVTDNEIAGGDSHYWWSGRVDEGPDGALNADLTVKQHAAGGDGSVFGFFDTMTVALTGRHVGEASQFDGQTMVGRPLQMNLRPLQLV